MPSRFAVRATRQAISPLLAMSIFANIRIPAQPLLTRRITKETRWDTKENHTFVQQQVSPQPSALSIKDNFERHLMIHDSLFSFLRVFLIFLRVLRVLRVERVWVLVFLHPGWRAF